MATNTRKSLQDLVTRVSRAPGWEVVDQGLRWRITNSEGGGPLFLHKRPPAGNTLKPVIDELAKRGWNEYEEGLRQTQERRERLAADRARNEAKAAEAQQLAEKRQAAAAELAARNKKLAPKLGSGAVQFGSYRKELIRLDGDFAAALLEHNAFFEPAREIHTPVGRTNRPVSPALVLHYQQQMERGELVDGVWVSEWKISHQGIALDTEGFLIDGQHRLIALWQAASENPDVTIESEVSYDLPPETMNIIDSGRKRTPTDILALAGYGNRLVLASAAKLLHKFDNIPYDEWYGVRLSNHQLLKIIEKNPGLQVAASKASALRGVTSASSVAAFLFIAGRVYRNAPLDDFMHGLRTGIGLTDGDPRLALRNYMEQARRRRYTRISNEQHLAFLLKTWNYWLTGKQVKHLVFREDEQFPRPIERV